MQAWVYEHFPFLRPNEPKKIGADVPRMLRWAPKRVGGKNVNANVTVLRIKLDELARDQVYLNNLNK